jgi:hypothetical protein
MSPEAPVQSGLDLLKSAKPPVDYSEKFEVSPEPIKPSTPALKAEPTTPEEYAAETAKQVPITPPPAPVVPAKGDDRALKEAQLRAEIAEREAIRAQAERDAMVQYQQMMAAQARPVAHQEQPLNDEQLTELMQQNPVKAARYIAETTAKQVREQTMRELSAQDRQQAMVSEFENKKKTFEANILEVHKQNPELQDANHKLFQIYNGLDKEMPYLLTIPEGPLHAIKIARERYELEQLKAGVQKPDAIIEAEKKGKEAEAARRNAVESAAMLAGPSRGQPPVSQVSLNDEEKLQARKMRLSPEEYSKYKGNTTSHFKTEAAPRRRVTV